VFVSIPRFLDKNFIGREPLKESVFGCLAGSTTRLLQLHEAIAEHTHSDLDEILYVVAGEGSVRVSGESTQVAAGSLSIIPRGTPHAIEQRGKNPLIMISTVSGAPCTGSASPQSAATTKK
jgi:oxalate decarboxylase/phosphoglucose isomerase-like protein (cupin superfamily)